MTKKELQEWVDQIPDDIFEKVYAMDPVNRYVQLEYSNELIKKHFLETHIAFDVNGYIKIEMPFGEITFT